jgi:ribosomal protein L24E
LSFFQQALESVSRCVVTVSAHNVSCTFCPSEVTGAFCLISRHFVLRICRRKCMKRISTAEEPRLCLNTTHQSCNHNSTRHTAAFPLPTKC